jgi:phospholipid/cholesterol/gamma-HCH transport system ATP-binding protein
MKVPIIEFKQVSKSFGTRAVLDQVDMKIYEGEISTIIGKSGTGKSVLLKHIIGLLGPDSGTILFRGKPLNKMSRKELNEFKKQFSYCFQNNALFDSMTVFDNIALPLRQTTKLKKKEIERRVIEKTDQLEIADALQKYPSELSGGMQKRVALARALITEPKIVLFDEPTTGQDPIRKNAIFSMITHNQKRFGFTTVMISHDLPDVFFISDRILILYDGKVSFQGTYEELGQFQHPIIDEFIKSLEGVQDELTGLHSSKQFTHHYQSAVNQKRADETFSVIVFGLEDMDQLSQTMGHTAAQEVVRAVGEIVNRHFGKVGISSRTARDRIATILPNTGAQDALKLLNGIAEELNASDLCGLPLVHPSRSRTTGPVEFRISAGIAEGSVTEDLEAISRRASLNLKPIATYHCQLKAQAIS